MARFDGIRFTIFNKSNSPGIISNRFINLEQSRDGDLWVAYESGGLLRYHAGKFRTYDSRDGIPHGDVSTITTDAGGNVWILSSGQVAQWNAKSDRFELYQPLSDRIYGPLIWDSTGFVAYDKTKVYCFSKGQSREFALPPRLQGKVISTVGLDQEHVAWLRMQSGEIVRLALITDHPKQVDSLDAVMYHGPDGKLWNFQPAQDVMRSIDARRGRESSKITFRYSYADHQGNLWLATAGQGLYRLQSQTISTYSTEQGLLDQDAYAIYQDRDGALWIGTWHKGLSRFQNGHFSNFTSANGLPKALVTAIYQERNGRLWVATHGGLATFQNGRFSTEGVPNFSQSVVLSIYQDRSGALWFGGRTGAFKFENHRIEPFSNGGGIASVDVHVITETQNGDLWFGGSNGLFQLHDGRVIQWSEKNGLGSNNVWSLYPDKDGILWIGTFDGGLARLKDGRITRYTTSNGLFDDGVFQILDDHRGNLWMSCSRGIYRVGKKELEEMATGSRTTISSISYGPIDGLRDSEMNGGISPAGTRATDGKLWFPTQDGVAVVDPSKVRVDSRPSRTIVESALVDQAPADLNGPITISPSQYSLQIQYTAPDFLRPTLIRFRYKLEGLDQDWTDAGFHRSASYSHLPPGNYRFLVSAMSPTGTWSQSSTPLSISVLAPFYKTRWFEAFVILFAALVAFSIWRYRLMELKARHALQVDFLQQLITSQEEERKRISMELHDSLGQRLVVINSTAKLALRFKEDPAKSKDSVLEEISSEAMAGLEDTRSIAYDLRPSHLDRLGLTQSIEYLVEKTADAAGIPITVQMDNIDDVVPLDQWINLYRIVQEGLGNIIKYSSASSASVRVDRMTDQIILRIEDDGVGFSVDRNVNKTGRIGIGLRGMAERATLLGGKFEVKSAPGQGTTLTALIPTSPADKTETPEAIRN
ncbi:ligand-binding sensor domain-containing protein [Terriglobus roseus]|uniref:ligand-binding sensor domain-containing protein n=1 Tax=Terriglobus roseus TaxID=392734 RepID=UPI001E595D7A|nr:sensor histidine kinase [Terriglobus roseus]